MRTSSMRVGCGNNLRQKGEGRIYQSISFQDRVERNFLTVVAQLASRDIVYDPVLDASPVSVVGKKHDLRVGVYKLLDQPRTCDPVDFNPFSRDPPHLEA